jgi:hypothetical protein
MRTLVNNAVSNYQPVYGFNAQARLNPGRTYRFDLALQPISRIIRAGSRLKLRISSSKDASMTRNPSRETLFHNGQFASRLWLPVQAPPGVVPVEFAPATTAPGNLQFPPIPQIQDQPAAAADQRDPAAMLFDSNSPVILLP